ncbi:MAG: AmmeMemoRadiSam system protein B [Verrucomicrobiae bacterium]|nr:AmmeMemoRadiSam system protein B [Verrucomicrobiae bacterium]
MSTTERVRPPAVAGLFYPRDATSLSRMLDRLLAEAPARALPNLRALICPHAGYEFSGPVAAHAYKLLIGRSYDTVIILAPSHYAAFEGASVPATDAYETPLGRVPMSPKAKQLAVKKPFVLEPRCVVHRPGWSYMSSRPTPGIGEDTPDTWEHSHEVQIPFLQKVLTNFSILPIVFGNVDPEAVAAALAEVLDDRTLVIASSDLCHYLPYERATEMDRRTIKWVCDLDVKSLAAPAARDTACGRGPMLTVMHLAKRNGWRPQLLDYGNSGDTSGDKSQGVVGYAAIAFSSSADSTTPEQCAATTATQPPLAGVKPESASSHAPVELTSAEKSFLLELARKTITSVTTGGTLPKIDPATVPPGANVSRGCFVTLTKHGQLRGCIGNILPAGPLYQAVIENARSAALHDYRFPPVRSDELKDIHIEISVLSEPVPVQFSSPDELLAKLKPGKDGVVLEIGERKATFLPQVWQQLPDKVEFLNHLAMKAGAGPSDWRGKDVKVSVYHVLAFEEEK